MQEGKTREKRPTTAASLVDLSAVSGPDPDGFFSLRTAPETAGDRLRVLSDFLFSLLPEK